MDDVCARCRSIPWDELACSEPPTCSEGVPIVEIPESHDELLSSPCRICRLLATTKSELPLGDLGRWKASKLQNPKPAEAEPESCVLTRFSAQSVLCEQADAEIEFNVSDEGQVLGMMFNDAGIHNWFWGAGFLGIHQSVPEADFGIRRIDAAAADFDMINDCLSICRNAHTECPSTRGPPIPRLRVIDCACAAPEVIEAPKDCEYVALSYVWSFTREDGAGFPPVIMDAITATVNMGFQYLWVDRHCIDQNDPEHRSSQIAHMPHKGDIYARAGITIIASSQNTTHYGLPGVGRCLRRPQREEKIGRLCLLEGFEHPVHELQDSHWATRGWTLQEFLLSSRRIIFSDTQVTFVCHTTHWAESWERPEPSPSPRRNWRFEYGGLVPISKHQTAGNFDAIRHSTKIMMEYSLRSLTYETDALDAMRGIIQNLGKSSVFCPWGVPTAGHRFMIDWYLSKGTRKRRRGTFPSWSFLGWQGGIDVPQSGTWDSQKLQIALGSHDEPALSLPLKGEIPTTEMLLLEDWRYLHITGPVTRLHMVHRKFTSQQRSVHTTVDLSHNGVSSMAIIPRPQDGWFASLQISQAVTMLLSMDLDTDVLPPSFFGLVLHSKTSVLHALGNASLYVMVLRESQGICERIGFLHHFLGDFIRPYSPPSHVPAMAFTDATGELLDEVVWRKEVGRGAGDRAEDPLWIKNAETKTIIIE